jgi:hypothetical protein
VIDVDRNFKAYMAESVTACDVFERISHKDDYSIFMNCEGAEYEVIGDFLKLDKIPKTIMFQSHYIGANTIPYLYKTRSDLANKGYTPLLNLNFAWDIWTLTSSKT